MAQSKRRRAVAKRKGTGGENSPFKKGTRKLKKNWKWPGGGRKPVFTG